MPSYDYRCKACRTRFTLDYKTYADYEAAIPQCPECSSTDLAELITRVAIQKPSRDYSSMSANEMLSVMESGDSRQVGEMFQQIGGTDPAIGAEYKEATERLLKGDKMESVEKDLQAKERAKAAESKPKPAQPPKSDSSTL